MDTPDRRRRHVALLPLLLVALALVAGSLAAAAPANAAGPAPGGVLTWASFNNPLNTVDQFRDAARGPGGTVFAGGVADYGANGGDALVVKYDPTGAEVWRYTGLPSGASAVVGDALAVNAGGGVAIVGQAWNGGNSDMFVIKLDASGHLQWSALKAGTADTWDDARGVAFDAHGNVCVSGLLDNEARAVVIKYAAAADPAHPLTGKVLWTNILKARAGGVAAAHSLAVDTSGNVYVAEHRTAANGHIDAVVRKIRPGGGTAWTRTWDGRAHRDDAAYEPVVRNGRVFVAGETYAVGHKTDLLLLRYDTSGHLMWARTWDDAAHRDDWMWDMAVDGSGNAFVASTQQPTATTYKGALIKWSATGVRRWVRQYAGTGGGAEFKSVTVGGSGTVWVSGFRQTASARRALAIRYSATGKRVWVLAWPGPSGSLNAEFWASALSGSDCLFATGVDSSPATQQDALAAWIIR